MPWRTPSRSGYRNNNCRSPDVATGALFFFAVLQDFKKWRDPDSNRAITMIFRHILRPLGRRQILIGKWDYVQGVPLDTSWFCPYCCATVDTAFILRPAARAPHTPPQRARSQYSSTSSEPWSRRLGDPLPHQRVLYRFAFAGHCCLCIAGGRTRTPSLDVLTWRGSGLHPLDPLGPPLRRLERLRKMPPVAPHLPVAQLED
jgi:hypothetical protein